MLWSGSLAVRERICRRQGYARRRLSVIISALTQEKKKLGTCLARIVDCELMRDVVGDEVFQPRRDTEG